jgi:hypothetical protein
MTKKSALRALANAIEDIQWMSAASDFAPDGKAHKGWVKVRTRLARYEEALVAAVEELPTAACRRCGIAHPVVDSSTVEENPGKPGLR